MNISDIRTRNLAACVRVPQVLPSPSTSVPQRSAVIGDRVTSDLMPLLDGIALLAALWLVSHPLQAGLAMFALTPNATSDWPHKALAATLLAPFILYDPQFGQNVRGAKRAEMVGSHLLRFSIYLLFALTLSALGNAAGAEWPMKLAWLLGLGFLLTALPRILIAHGLWLGKPRKAPLPASAEAVPDSGTSHGSRGIGYLGTSFPVHVLAERPIGKWNTVIKAGGDFLISSCLTLLLLPVFAFIALAIKFDSRGPILYRQRRHALDNREFDVLKFRTMRSAPMSAATPLQQTSRNDPRVTAVGRFLRASSLDELPQLLNVLRGDMSLVGPRPHAVDMRTEGFLGEEISNSYTHRHRIKPGITGWSQVNGARGATDFTAQLITRVDLDLHYINNWSLWLDIKILAMTFWVVLRPTNAY